MMSRCFNNTPLYRSTSRVESPASARSASMLLSFRSYSARIAATLEGSSPPSN